MFRRPGQFWEEVLANGRQGYLSVTGILALEEGVPLEHEGQIVGSIGISEAKSIEDGIIAKAGAAVLQPHLEILFLSRLRFLMSALT